MCSFIVTHNPVVVEQVAACDVLMSDINDS